MNIYKRTIFIVILSLSAMILYANKPYIININREEYQADNKNWSIGQDERGIVYFGNDIGLLEFDGIEWKLNQLPNTLVVRSVAVLSHNTVFTGSYEEFGRWDRDISGKLIYTSLSKNIDKKLFKNDDFWKIWITEDKVYFQSFSSIYIYDYNTIERVPFKDGFLFLSKVRDEFLVQQIVGPLYRLNDKEVQKIEGSDIFRNADVRVILPYSDNKYLIGTATRGIYIYDGNTFEEWNSSLSALMNSKELNCGILSSKGVYYLGTILDGIYIVDIKGNIIDHISTESTLQNNTILALYEDNQNNVWVALDRGISYIQYFDNMSCFSDPGGKTGAVYDAIIWNNKLFIATNQGVFYVSEEDMEKPDALSRMKLINNTQGQVWSLKNINGTLYCCHNKGLRRINKDLSISEAYYIGTGVYNITEAKIKGRDLLFLSTYSTLRVVDEETEKVSLLGRITEPLTNTIIDHLGNIWLEHFNRGVYRCRLDDTMKDFKNLTYYGGNNDDGLPYKLKIFKVGGRVVLLGDDKFYIYDDINDRIIPNDILNKCFRNTKDIRQIVNIQDNIFWALTKSAIYKFYYDGYEASISESYNLGMNLSLVNSYENISILNDSLNLICLDNGFLLYNSSIPVEDNNKVLSAPYLESFQMMNINGNKMYKDLSDDEVVPYKFNTVTFSFSSDNIFTSNLSFQCMLKNVDKDWSSAQKVNKISYERLPEGHYEFMVRSVDNIGNYSDTTSFTFTISPPWYQMWWAYLLYFLIVVFILYTTWMLILRRYRNLHLQKIRYRETKRLRALAGRLKHEIEIKNAELLTQTSFIIQKNELIMKLREIIDDFYRKNTNKALAPMQQKINVLLNSVDTEDDWKMFLIKFEQKHAGFFKKLKMMYPQLTNNDLRLCACIKLNLDIKETASLMNLSVRAVENSRYRLRKKLNLQPADNLYDFFIDID